MADVAAVTGAGRGIGLELCRQLLEQGWTVVACPRVAGSDGLAELKRRYAGRVHEVPIDVVDDDSVARGAERAAQLVEHIDLLLNNAGVFPSDGGKLETLDAPSLLEACESEPLG